MSLFWKILITFMIAMTITLVGAVYVSFRLAGQSFDQVNIEGRDKIIQEVSEALARGGERELKQWLFKHPRPSPGTVLLVTNERGDELLGRAMPRELARLLVTRPFVRPQAPPNLRPMQLTPQMIGPNNEEYRLLFARAPLTVFGVLMWPGTQVAVLSIALFAAAAHVPAARALLVVADRAAAEGEPRACGGCARNARRPAVRPT